MSSMEAQSTIDMQFTQHFINRITIHILYVYWSNTYTIESFTSHRYHWEGMPHMGGVHHTHMGWKSWAPVGLYVKEI